MFMKKNHDYMFDVELMVELVSNAIQLVDFVELPLHHHCCIVLHNST